ncbi:hypothetical protein [Hymenobacter agri]
MMDTADSKAAEAAPEAYWTAVGNIVRERPFGPGGAEIRNGTKHFAPGAKVYIIDWYAGMCERIVVVGMHRKSKKFIRLVIDVKLVKNLRPKLCYTPAVIQKIKEHYPSNTITWLTEELVKRMCDVIPYWQTELKKGAGAFKHNSDAIDTSDFQEEKPFFSRLWIDIKFILNQRQ